MGKVVELLWDKSVGSHARRGVNGSSKSDAHRRRINPQRRAEQSTSYPSPSRLIVQVQKANHVSCSNNLSVDRLRPHSLNNSQFQGMRTTAGVWKVSDSFSARFAFNLATATYRMAKTGKTTKETTPNFGFEAKLWMAADTATCVSAKTIPRSHAAGLLRSERQHLANPPFNDSDWFRKGNANFAWVQYFIHHLAPQGMAGSVLAIDPAVAHSRQPKTASSFSRKFCLSVRRSYRQ